MQWKSAICDGFEHEQLPLRYTASIELALQAVEEGQKRLYNSTLAITFDRLHHDPFDVLFEYPVTVEETYYSRVEDRHMLASCQSGQLAETICFVVARALELIESEEDD